MPRYAIAVTLPLHCCRAASSATMPYMALHAAFHYDAVDAATCHADLFSPLSAGMPLFSPPPLDAAMPCADAGFFSRLAFRCHIPARYHTALRCRRAAWLFIYDADDGLLFSPSLRFR